MKNPTTTNHHTLIAGLLAIALVLCAIGAGTIDHTQHVPNIEIETNAVLRSAQANSLAAFGSSKQLQSATSANVSTALRGIFSTKWGTNNTLFVFEGDSLTSGSPASTNNYAYVLTNQFFNTTTFPWIFGFSNVAAPGETVSMMQTQYTSQVYPYRPTATNDSILFFWGGANDLSSVNPSTTWQRITNYWATAKADGFKIVAFTITDSINGTAEYLGRRTMVNKLIRASWAQGLCDYLVDTSELFPFYLQMTSDGVHFDSSGNYMIANAVYNTLTSPASGQVAPWRRTLASDQLILGNYDDNQSYMFSRNTAYAAWVRGKYPQMLFEDVDQNDAFLIAPYGGSTKFLWKDGAGNLSGTTDNYLEFGTTGVKVSKPLTVTSSASMEVVQATKAFRPYYGVLTHNGTVTLDFDGLQNANTIQLTGAVTFAFSNVATNRTYDLLIKGVSTNASITWPSGVHGGPLTVSTGGKWMRASFEGFGTGDTNVFIATSEDP